MPNDTSRAAKKTVLRVSLAAVAAGSDLTSILFAAPFAGRVRSVKYIPKADANGDNTNYRTYTVTNRGSDGAGTTAVATLTQTAGVDLDAYVPKAFTLNATVANRNVEEGDVLSIQSVKTGTGLADPGGVLEITLATGVGSTD